MGFFENVEERQEVTEHNLKIYLEEYDFRDDDWRMEKISRILDAIRSNRKLHVNTIYIRLEGLHILEPLIAKAQLQHELLNVLLETIINIHVDEPHHEYSNKLTEMLTLIKSLRRLDRILMKAFRETLSLKEEAEFEKKFNEEMFDKFTSSPVI